MAKADHKAAGRCVVCGQKTVKGEKECVECASMSNKILVDSGRTQDRFGFQQEFLKEMGYNTHGPKPVTPDEDWNTREDSVCPTPVARRGEIPLIDSPSFSKNALKKFTLRKGPNGSNKVISKSTGNQLGLVMRCEGGWMAVDMVGKKYSVFKSRDSAANFLVTP